MDNFADAPVMRLSETAILGYAHTLNITTIIIGSIRLNAGFVEKGNAKITERINKNKRYVKKNYLCQIKSNMVIKN